MKSAIDHLEMKAPISVLHANSTELRIVLWASCFTPAHLKGPTREDQAVVALSRGELAAVPALHPRERRPADIYSAALAPVVCLLSGALCLLRRIGQRKDGRPRALPLLLLYALHGSVHAYIRATSPALGKRAMKVAYR